MNNFKQYVEKRDLNLLEGYDEHKAVQSFLNEVWNYAGMITHFLEDYFKVGNSKSMFNIFNNADPSKLVNAAEQFLNPVGDAINLGKNILVQLIELLTDKSNIEKIVQKNLQKQVIDRLLKAFQEIKNAIARAEKNHHYTLQNNPSFKRSSKDILIKKYILNPVAEFIKKETELQQSLETNFGIGNVKKYGSKGGFLSKIFGG